MQKFIKYTTLVTTILSFLICIFNILLGQWDGGWFVATIFGVYLTIYEFEKDEEEHKKNT